jgi:hypothetical protein
MFQFTGYLSDKKFVGFTEAASPSDLYSLWKSADDPPLEKMRCWVLLKTPSSSVWVEVVLDVPSYFDCLKPLFEDQISIEFRAKGKSSPNSSPHPIPSKESSGVDTAETVQVTESLQTLGMSDGLSTPTAGSHVTSKVTSIDFSELVNDKDPFTMEHVEAITDPLLLRFPKQKIAHRQVTLCVSLDGFERFVRSEADAGKDLIGLELNRVVRNGGRELSLVLGKDVWLLSILEHCREIPNTFRDLLKCSIERESLLQEMQNDKEFWQRVLFWVSDFLDFRASQERLTLPPEDGITPFMSPYYFSKEEAQGLGGLYMPNSANLHVTLMLMLEEKAAEGALEICASHDIAPVLFIGFGIKKGDLKNEKFKSDKKKWIKKREKEMQK